MARSIAWVAGVVASTIAAGCGGDVSATDAGLTDAGAADVAGGALTDAGVTDSRDAAIDVNGPSGIPRCGPPPWLLHEEQYFRGWGTRAPVVDMHVRIDACPELDLRTDAEGWMRIAFTHGRPYDLRTGLPGYPPIWGGRFSGLVPNNTGTYFLEPKKGAPYDPNAVVLKLQFYNTPGRPPPCDNRQNIRAHVLEYPDAKTHYWAGEVETDDPADSRINDITIDGLPEGIDVTVVPEKPGCRMRAYWWWNRLKKTRTHLGQTQVDVEVLEALESPDGGADSGDGG